MRKFFRLAGVTLFVALSCFMVAFGALYTSVHDLLWFHAAAVPNEALEAVRPLYFALMKLIGGASGSLGALGAFVALTAVRRCDKGAAVALALAFAAPLVTAANVAETLAAETGSPTSWRIMGALLAVDVAALLSVLIGGRDRALT
ncbi:MAG: hypothetical protein A3E78_15260 [Alphaproteobacteria bacterium RIFCSPHIGHO2_12_FULL_63_12]|nr:MAG: hypothetical protein A3E78_15260 [Alphaproteobacteria bacterium RIFCSPHIGHO2_12_FULL_63_12]